MPSRLERVLSSEMLPGVGGAPKPDGSGSKPIF